MSLSARQRTQPQVAYLHLGFFLMASSLWPNLPRRGARSKGSFLGLNKHDPDLGIVTPDGLACSDGFACE